MVKESKYGIDNKEIFRFTGNSEQDVLDSGGSSTSVTYGKGCATFNGSSSLIDFGEDSKFYPGLRDFTVVGRYKVSASLDLSTDSNIYPLIGNQENATGIEEGWSMALRGGSNRKGLQLRLSDGSSNVLINPTSDIRTQVADGEFHTIVMTFDRDGNGVIYLDGVSVGSGNLSSLSSSFIKGDGSLYIGHSGPATPKYYNGDIDFISVIMDEIWSASDILAWHEKRLYKKNKYGLIGEWNLSTDWSDGSTLMYDSSGNANLGTSANTITFSNDQLSRAAKSMNFNGSTDYVSIPNSAVFPSVDISVFAWVNLDNWGSANQDFVSRFGGDNSQWKIGISAGSVLQPAINTDGGLMLLAYDMNEFTGWHLIGFTFEDSGYMTLYVDGKEINKTNTNTGTIVTSSDSIRIGSRLDGSFFTTGDISQTRIWNRKLSQTEINQMHEREFNRFGGHS